MKKEIFSFWKRVSLLLFTFCLLSFQNSFSQCTNRIPTGNTSPFFCAIDRSTIGDLNINGGTIVWFDSLNGGNKYNSSATLTNGFSYFAEDIDGGNCSPRLEVIVSVYGAVPTNVDVFVGKCASDNPTIDELSADGSNIVWYDSQTDGSKLKGFDLLVDGATYWVQQTENGCISDRLPTTVNLINPTSPTVNPLQSFCSSANPIIGDLKAVENNVIWYDTETSSIPLSPTFSLIDQEDYWAAQTSFPCESTIRTQTTVSIDIAPIAGTNGSYSECEVDLTTTNLFDLLDGTPENNGTWSGPSALSGGDLGVFEPGVNTEGTYTYTVSSSLGVCANETATVNVIILKELPPTTSQTTQTFCEINNATVADLFASGNGILWYDNDTSNTPLSTTTVLINGKDYYASQTNVSGCESASRLMVTANITAPLPPTTTDSNQTFCEIDSPTVADLTATGTGILWYDTETSTTALNITDPLIDGEDYWASQTDVSGCESSSRLVVTASITTPLPPTTSESNQSFCEIDNPTVADLTAIGTGILWYDTETSTTALNVTDTLIDGGDYWASQTETAGCESKTRLVITTTIIKPLPPTTVNTTQSFCEIDNPTVADLTATGTGVLWYDTETSTNSLNTTDVIIDGEDYWASQTDASGCESATRLIVIAAIIKPLPPTTSQTTQTFCEIDNPTVADLSATGNGILWYDTDTSNTPLDATTVLIGGEDYYASQTNVSGCESASKLMVTANITAPLPPTTTDSNQTFCEIDSPTVADLSAIGTGILWYDTEISTTALTTSSVLIDGEDYWASQTDVSGCESITRLVVTATITAPLPPTTSESNQSFCEIDNPTVADLTAIGTGILWYDTETSTTALNVTDTLIDGEDYWGSQTETAGCESKTRLVITTTIIKPLPPTTVNSTQSFCKIDNPTVADLTATGTGILWYDTETSTTSLVVTDVLIDGEDYWATQTDASGCESATRLIVTAAIIKPLPPTTTESTQSFCDIDNPTITDLTASGTGVLWYDTEISTTPLAITDALIDGEDYWATQTDISGCESATRLIVTATIIIPSPPTTTETNQSFCISENATITDLTASGTGVLWYGTETSTTALNITNPLIDGEDYWASQTDVSGCESLTRLVVTATITAPLPPTTSESNQTFCEIDNSTVADLTAIGTGILWYDTETSTTPITITDTLIDGEDYWASQSLTFGCESNTRIVVTATILKPQPPTTSGTTQSFCEIDNPTIANLTASGTGILWYDSETSTTPIAITDTLIDSEDYWATQTETAGCESATRLMVTVSILKPLPPTTTESTQSFCEIDSPTIAYLAATGTGILWYDTEISTTPLATTDALIHGEDYWATQTDISGCQSATRLIVTATINKPLPPTTAETNQTFCKVQDATVADLSVDDSGILWYDSAISTIPLNPIDDLIDGEDYWASQTDALGCESISRLVITVNILDELPPTTSEITQTFCKIDNATVASLIATGTTINWYNSETSTTPLAVTEILANSTYWATQTGTSGCESDSRLAITVTITATLPPTTSQTNQSFCTIDYPTNSLIVDDLDVTGTTIIWYDSETSTTPLNGSDLLVHGQDYWASQTDISGCESATRMVVNVSIPNPPIAVISEAIQTFCLVNNPTVENLQAAGDLIVWYDTETSTTPLNLTDNLITGEDYWALNTDALTGCESASKEMVTVAIMDEAPATLNSVSQLFCVLETPTIADLQASGVVEWYASENDIAPLNSSDLLIGGNSYWAASINSTTGCLSSVKVEVTVTLSEASTPILATQGNEFCVIDTPTISDLDTKVSTSNGGSIIWYDSYPNGNELSFSQFLTDEETYYAIEIDSNGCSSINPLEVTVDLNACDEYDITTFDGFSPNGDGINDTFKFENIRILYPDFKVEFFNRWGNLMYTSNVNLPDWNGRLHGDGDDVPSGIYFFIVSYNKEDRKPTQGRLYLSR